MSPLVFRPAFCSSPETPAVRAFPTHPSGHLTARRRITSRSTTHAQSSRITHVGDSGKAKTARKWGFSALLGRFAALIVALPAHRTSGKHCNSAFTGKFQLSEMPAREALSAAQQSSSMAPGRTDFRCPYAMPCLAGRQLVDTFDGCL
jgi:hypothetical protein